LRRRQHEKNRFIVAQSAGSAMELYGIASASSREIEDLYPTREEAEAVLAEALRNEPELEGELWVEAVELNFSAN
jgi:hypothetical protein